MRAKILVAGATGNLGQRIIKALSKRDAEVLALVRPGAEAGKLGMLQALGAQVVTIKPSDTRRVTGACEGVACVVSALAGLREVIVDAQSTLLAAAIAAGVPRFIPSDFSTDFTKLPAGNNRNFDLRREFRQRLQAAPIAATSIFNGAFAEILTYHIPLLDFARKTVGYWDDPDHRIDFTTMDDTAEYTAEAALDAATPEALRIASFQVSARELARFTDDVLHTPFELVRLGSLAELAAHNRRERAAYPEGEVQLYCRWQQSQYLHDMFSTQHASLDNDRYAGLRWTPLANVVRPNR